MSFGTVKLIEGLVFVGAALGLGIWQYVSVSREVRRDREKAAKNKAEEVPSGAAGHAEGEHELHQR